MRMIRAVVVDDEPLILAEIGDMVRETGLFADVLTFDNPIPALAAFSGLLPDVAFIDIDMPEMDGITLAEQFLRIHPKILIVFITSWNQYAVQAFDLNAQDYILKPIRRERFFRTIEKIRGELNSLPIAQSSSLEIRCFGAFEARIGGVTVKWERAKAEELFAYMLTRNGITLHKEHLLERMWPLYSPEKSLPILQTAICKIRKVFAPVPACVNIEYRSSKYCLTVKDAVCDYFTAEQMLAGRKDLRMEELTRLVNWCEAGFLGDNGYLWSLETDARIRTQTAEKIREAIRARPSERTELAALLFRLEEGETF